jgi:uncharacterized protein YdiU (UPF0061 family)
MLREALIGEAMQALGIPTTRALAVVATGDMVPRDRMLPGAVLARVAASHLRVGTFEYFAARGDTATLERLRDYALARHGPAQVEAGQDPALVLLREVARRQAALVAQWMGVGFIHGVMNTDNMSISGQSIDFGPCAFMEVHDPATVYSSIDRQGRYAYGNQPAIAQWNLARLADALWPVMQGSDEEKLAGASAVVQGFADDFEQAMAAVWAAKMGYGGAAVARNSMSEGASEPACDGVLTWACSWARSWAPAWQTLMQTHRVDHTLGWRALLHAHDGQMDRALQPFGAGADEAREALQRWRSESAARDLLIDRETLRTSNPRVVPRNHQVEAALAAASDGKGLGLFDALMNAVRRPWDEDEALQPYAQPAPPDVAAGHRTFCGT